MCTSPALCTEMTMSEHTGMAGACWLPPQLQVWWEIISTELVQNNRTGNHMPSTCAWVCAPIHICRCKLFIKFKSVVIKCGNLNEWGDCRLMCLNAWSLVVELFGKDWGHDLVGGGVSLEVGFEVSKTYLRLSLMFSLPPVYGSHEFSAVALESGLPAYYHASCHDDHTLTIRKLSIKWFLSKVALVMVSASSNRLVTKTLYVFRNKL